jgi:hypothetical protein
MGHDFRFRNGARAPVPDFREIPRAGVRATTRESTLSELWHLLEIQSVR